jgi:hypothetical protein
MRILLNANAGDGGTPPSENAPSPAAAPAAAPPAAEPPPAATAVVTGKKSEREVQLEKDLEAERKRVKDREVQVSELQDENFRLKGKGTPKQKRTSVTLFRYRE